MQAGMSNTKATGFAVAVFAAVVVVAIATAMFATTAISDKAIQLRYDLEACEALNMELSK